MIEKILIQNDLNKTFDIGFESLWLEISPVCHLNCTYCFSDIQKEDITKESLTINEIEYNVLRPFKDAGGKWVAIPGAGEPFHPKNIQIIKHIIKIMTYSIMLGGMVVLSLILILWLRERIYEIGIFLSIGTSKIQIIMQFIFELLFISIPSIISSLFLGNVLLKVIAGGLINSENSMISGGNLINDSSFMLNITTLGQSYLILISIIVLSVVFASSLILIKKPKEILSKIS